MNNAKIMSKKMILNRLAEIEEIEEIAQIAQIEINVENLRGLIDELIQEVDRSWMKLAEAILLKKAS